MEYLSSILGSVIPFLVVLTVLIFVHELGHFLVARWAGVRVEVFSIGFGRELFGRTDKHGTRWRFSAVPLGGYVKMFGEGDLVTGVDDTEDRPMTKEEKKVSFHHKPLRKRTAIVAAGPLANFIFAIVVYTFISGVLGMPRFEAAVGTVIPATAAEEAGFKRGDRILSVDGEPVQWFSDLSTIVSASAGVALKFEIERERRVFTIEATPRLTRYQELETFSSEEEREAGKQKDEQDDGKNEAADNGGSDVPPRGLLGVRPHPDFFTTVRVGPAEALWAGVRQTYALSAKILYVLGEMIGGERDASELGGVISIAKYSGEAAEDGLITALMFMAALSINLGLINLFPVPMLDGGHLVFYTFEALRGKPLSERTQEYGFRFGLVLVVALMIFATWNDISAF